MEGISNYKSLPYFTALSPSISLEGMEWNERRFFENATSFHQLAFCTFVRSLCDEGLGPF